MTLRELAVSGLYVSLLAALDRGRFSEVAPASTAQRPEEVEPGVDDFEDTLPFWVLSTTDDDPS